MTDDPRRFLPGRTLFYERGWFGLLGTARPVDPSCRFIYVADDPITLAHARALLVGRPGSDVTVVAGDFRAPERVLADPNVTAHLELDRPVGVLLFGMLDYIRDPRMASAALATLVDWVPPGSMIALQHVQEVGMAEVDEAVYLLSAQEKLGLTPRSPEETILWLTSGRPRMPTRRWSARSATCCSTK